MNTVLKELSNTINYCKMFVVICALCYVFVLNKDIKEPGNMINYCMFVVICVLCIRFERTSTLTRNHKLLYNVCCTLRAIYIYVFVLII